MLDEHREKRKRALEEEKLTQQFLDDERHHKQQELDNKLYDCMICFDEFKIEV